MPSKALRVLVTAGAAGIGRAIAEAYIQASARVHICDISREATETFAAEVPEVSATVADVTQLNDLDRLFDSVEEKMGGIDVLVNNAGISGPRAAIEDTEELAWERCVSVNLNAPFFTMKRAIPYMKRQGSGAILNISTSSVRTGLPYRSSYVASKAGLISLTRNAARELGPFGIRCNAILPGIIDNPRGRALIQRYAQEHSMDADTASKSFLSYVSMRTMIAPEEVADLCVFLAGLGGRHITGQAIGVCGNVEWET